jgi:hypothetical protein
MRITRSLLAIAVAGLVSGHAMAQSTAFYTDDPGDLGTVQRLDFGGAGVGGLGVTLGTSGVASTTVGPFTISNAGTGVVLGDGEAVQLGQNGSWQAAAPWDNAASGAPIRAFVNGNLNDDNSVTFALAPGQWTTAVGLSWMTDATTALPAGTLRLEIFDTNGSLIDAIGPGSASVTQSPNPPFGTSYVNGRAFHGFDTEGAAQIGSFRVTGDYHVYGDVVYAQPIPEPSEIAFMLAGLAAAGAVARRRAARGGASAA